MSEPAWHEQITRLCGVLRAYLEHVSLGHGVPWATLVEHVQRFACGDGTPARFDQWEMDA